MKTEQQQLAQDLYLNTDKTQQEIADILNVHRRTIYLWVKNGRWEEIKLAARQAPGIILQDIYNHIEAVNGKVRSRSPEDRCPTMQEVEMLRKLINMTKAFQKKHTGSYIEAFMELICYINKSDHDLATRTRRFADRYIEGTLGNLPEKSFYISNDKNACVNEVINNLEKIDLSAVAEEKQTAEETVIASNPEGLPLTNMPHEQQTQSYKSVNSENPVIVSNAEPANVIFCDKNVIFSPAPEEPAGSTEKPDSTASGGINTVGGHPSEYHIGNFSENVIFPESSPNEPPPS